MALYQVFVVAVSALTIPTRLARAATRTQREKETMMEEFEGDRGGNCRSKRNGYVSTTEE